MNTRAFPDWNELYGKQAVESMPWYYAPIDPDLERGLAVQQLSPDGARVRRALDLGTGPGTQALALAERGFTVTASDLSAHAVMQARVLGAQKNLRIDFVQDDVLHSQLPGGFDVVFDRGCFHVLSPELRTAYARTLARLLKPGGVFFLKCFSFEQPGELGPYRLHPQDIESTFQAAFEVITIENTVYQGTLDPLPRALFCTLRKR